ncbi:MAG TPA: hypothetical protein VMM58_13390 [Bacteroidota bacterium]|nr:hypothetical protein [Bacteroidota bacterium]
MEHAKHSVEFEAEVDEEGKIHFSRLVADDLRLRHGAKVTVRIVGGVLSKELTARDVSDDEIERIGKIQFEEREQVVKFLSAEGLLTADAGFKKRLKRFSA